MRIASRNRSPRETDARPSCACCRCGRKERPRPGAPPPAPNAGRWPGGRAARASGLRSSSRDEPLNARPRVAKVVRMSVRRRCRPTLSLPIRKCCRPIRRLHKGRRSAGRPVRPTPRVNLRGSRLCTGSNVRACAVPPGDRLAPYEKVPHDPRQVGNGRGGNTSRSMAATCVGCPPRPAMAVATKAGRIRSNALCTSTLAMSSGSFNSAAFCSKNWKHTIISNGCRPSSNPSALCGGAGTPQR